MTVYIGINYKFDGTNRPLIKTICQSLTKFVNY